MRIICAQGQRLNLFVLQTKKIQFLLSFAVLTDKKYVKKSKVALLHSNASFLRCFVYHWRILVNVHGLVFYGLHSWNTCFHRIRISNTCHFRVCVLVMLCPRRLLDSIVSFCALKDYLKSIAVKEKQKVLIQHYLVRIYKNPSQLL